MKILVVDDEKDMQMLFEQRFRKEMRNGEVDFVFAFSGEEALTYLNQHVHEVVLILSDINMPGMSGIDLLVEVHKRYPRMSVLILTAHAALESAIQAVRLGARDYLIKPVEPVLILTRVAEILAEGEEPARKKEIVSAARRLLDALIARYGATEIPE